MLSIGEPLQILLPDGEAVSATIVWGGEEIFACKFDTYISADVLGAGFGLSTRICFPMTATRASSWTARPWANA